MLKYLFTFFVFIHGCIHFMGFAKAYSYCNITALTKDISKTAGAAWLVAAFLLVAAALFFIIKKESWAIIAVIAVIVSQGVIITSWNDAKYGTIANIIIAITAIAAMAGFSFQ